MRTTRVRIKYTKSGNKITSEPVLCGTRALVAEIDVKTMDYLIKDSDGALVHWGRGKHLSSAKLYIRRSFKSMGATFGDEIRARGKVEKL